MSICVKSGRLLVLIALLFAGQMLPAQRFSFQRYGEAQGLMNLVVTALLQDREGYIWVATYNGLFRYDGTSFKRYGEDEGFPAGSPGFLTETPDGTLWAMSRDALYRLQGQHFQKFVVDASLVGPQPAVWMEDSSRFLLATDRGLASVTYKDGKIGKVVYADPNHEAQIWAIYAAPDGGIWYSFQDKICHIASVKTTCFGSDAGVTPDVWTAIRMDHNGDLWIRSEKHLRVLRAGARRFVDDGSALAPADGTGMLSLDREGNLFVPTQRGLARLRDGHWDVITMRQGLTSNSTQVVLEDQEGSLWVGHPGAGLERWRGYDSWEGWTDLEGLDNISILSIAPAANGDLYLGTDRGLLQFRPGKGTIRTWLEADGLAGEHVYTLAYDRAGDLWAGSLPGGLSRLDIHTGKISRIYPAKGEEAPGILTLAMEKNGSIWAGSNHRLLRFTGTKATGYRLDTPPGSPYSQTFGVIVDHAGRVWAASGGKIYLRVDDSWSILGPAEGIQGGPVYLAEGTDGSVLTLTSDVQAYRITGDRGHWHSELLPPLPVPGRLVPYQLGVDARNAVWVGTDRGVFVLEAGASGWRWHNEEDGLVWNDTNVGAFRRGLGKDVWIGTSRGLAHYMPAIVSRPHLPLRTLISGVEINGHSLDPSGTLTWTYPAKSVQLRVTALTFLNESRTRFLYRRRESGDTGWQRTDSRVIMYSDLIPGTSTFDVLAEATDGSVGITPATITLTILPPWYLTRAFLVLSLTAILLLIVLGYKLRTLSFIRRQRQLETAVADRTAELEAERILERNQHRVLEMIASSAPLEHVFTGIVDLLSSKCSHIDCIIHSGVPPVTKASKYTRLYIRSNSPEPVGWIDVDHKAHDAKECDLSKTMTVAMRLAAVAIESASSQDKLTYQARHDFLTGLPNRLHFQERLQEATQGSNRTGNSFAIVYIDLDRFKPINDRYGHRIGDLYLQALSKRFSSCLRKADMLARLGGDEFAALLLGTDSSIAAERVVLALQQSLTTTLSIEDLEFHPRASFGYSLYPDDGTDIESLLRAADEAMYVAKRAGKTDGMDRERISA
jgi:diguanylate cyclase (GGDEF)-like protein